MKALKIAIMLLILVIFFIIAHGIIVNKLSHEMLEILSKIENYVDEENWQEASKVCAYLEETFSKKVIWLHVTIDSKETREMENSIYRIKMLAEKKQPENLYSEIALTKKMLEYLPKKEGFNLMEIL